METTDNIQERLQKAFNDPVFARSPQKRRVALYIIEHPGKLTHHINAAASCGNVSHTAMKAKLALIANGIAMYCHPPKIPHRSAYGEISPVQCRNAELLENYDAKKWGVL